MLGQKQRGDFHEYADHSSQGERLRPVASRIQFALRNRHQATGLSNPRVLRSADDKNEIVIIFDTTDTKEGQGVCDLVGP